LERVSELHTLSRCTYGLPRIYRDLRADGVAIGRKRVERLMRQARISGTVKRRRGRTTVRVPGVRVADDLVKRDFQPPAVNRLWIANITYLRTWQGSLYLGVVVDCYSYSRRVVGRALEDHLRAELVVDALQQALQRRRPKRGLVHHSDQGSQYVSLAFGRRCRLAGIEQSMGRRRSAYDNAVCESFFNTLKSDLIDRRSWPEKAELRTRSSTTSRRSTTANAATPASATSHQPNTRRSPNEQERPHNPVSTKAGELRISTVQQRLARWLDTGGARLADGSQLAVANYPGCQQRSHFGGHARYGYARSQHRFIFGVRLVLLTDLRGLPLGYTVVPANEHEYEYEPLANLLTGTHAELVIADKGFWGRLPGTARCRRHHTAHANVKGASSAGQALSGRAACAGGSPGAPARRGRARRPSSPPRRTGRARARSSRR
jgi:putative transposase